MKYGTIEALSAKLKPNEPWFVLRGQDRYAVEAVRQYAGRLYNEGDFDGFYQVHQIADAMVEWQRANGCKEPD